MRFRLACSPTDTGTDVAGWRRPPSWPKPVEVKFSAGNEARFAWQARVSRKPID